MAPMQKSASKPQQKKTQKKPQQKGQKAQGMDPMAVLAALGLMGKGKGKGQSTVGNTAKKSDNKFAEKLKKIDAEKKVWVGGLAKGTTWKDVEQHFGAIMKPKLSDVTVRRDGTATATLAYGSADDVATVVTALNGSELKGKSIEVDVWQKGTYDKSEKKEQKKGQKKANKKGKKKATQGLPANLLQVLSKFGVKAKGNDTKARDKKIGEKLKGIDATLKVWIGGLSQKTTVQKLREHFSAPGKPKVVELLKKGKGVVSYASADAVATAIATLNGSELDGAMLEVDSWVRPERPDKKKKEA